MSSEIKYMNNYSNILVEQQKVPKMLCYEQKIKSGNDNPLCHPLTYVECHFKNYWNNILYSCYENLVIDE